MLKLAGGTSGTKAGLGHAESHPPHPPPVTMAGKTLLESQCVRTSTRKVCDGIFSAAQNLNINTEAAAYHRRQTKSRLPKVSTR